MQCTLGVSLKDLKAEAKKPTLKQNVTQQAALHSPAQPAPLAKWAETNFQDLAVQRVANCQDMSQLSEHLAGMRPSPILKMVQGIVWRRIKTCSTRQASFIPVLNNPIVVYHVISCLSFVFSLRFTLDHTSSSGHARQINATSVEKLPSNLF